MMWIVFEMLADLLLSIFILEKQLLGNKASKNQPIRNKDKYGLECGVFI
jgi:hypothetical protein